MNTAGAQAQTNCAKIRINVRLKYSTKKSANDILCLEGHTEIEFNLNYATQENLNKEKCSK